MPSKASTTAAAPSAVPPPPPWIELPGDVTANILGRLGAEEILRSAQSVCTTWWKVCQDPAMWRVIHLSRFDLEGKEQYTTITKYISKLQREYSEEYATMCRRAVDRSQGQLVDLLLHDIGDDELIEYITDRSSNLKRLTLEYCYDISGECLGEAVKKLPHLEELHLTIAPRVGAFDIKDIGISCPKLKSFSFNRTDYYDLFEGIDLAIGEGMPNLRHLQLFANHVRNPGLEAILDGCPHLESLDIRECFELDLGGDLGRRCRDRIKDLKLPTYNSISDGRRLGGEGYDWHFDEYDDYSDQSDNDYGYYGYRDGI